jgi:syringomycin synthetase protein SyrE
MFSVPQVGVHDSFFVLGGHSLLAVRIAARLTQELEGNVPLSLLFSHPVVAELARKIDVSRDKSTVALMDDWLAALS